MFRARRCPNCIRAHRACSKSSARDEEPCDRCAKRGLECVSTLLQSDSNVREIGYKIELARSMFGGEPLRQKKVDTVPSKSTSYRKKLNDKEVTEHSSDSSGKHQNLAPTSRENSIRRLELAGQLRVDLINYNLKRFLSMASRGSLWLPSRFRSNGSLIARMEAKAIIEFLELFHCSGKNTKSPVLGRFGELRASIYVCLGASRLRGFDTPLSGAREGCQPFAIKHGTIEECQIAANQDLSKGTAAYIRWVGRRRQEVLIAAVRECKHIVQRDILDHKDLELSSEERDIVLTLIPVVEACLHLTKENVHPIWTAVLLEFRSLLRDCNNSKEMLRSPAVRDIIERVTLYDCLKACVCETVPDLPDNLVLNLMTTLHSEPVARVTLSIRDESSIPIPKDRKERVDLIWATLLALDRMTGVCAISTRTAPISVALNIFERLFIAFTARERWLRLCSHAPLPSQGCQQCRTTAGPCPDCMQAEVTLDLGDKYNSTRRFFQLLRMVDDLGKREEFCDPEVQERFWERWNGLRKDLKAQVDDLLWKFIVQQLVQPVSTQNPSDLSQLVFGIGYSLIYILGELPGGIAYLSQEAEASGPTLSYTRKQQVKKMRTVMIHTSGHAGLDNERLDMLDATISKWENPPFTDHVAPLAISKQPTSIDPFAIQHSSSVLPELDFGNGILRIDQDSLATPKARSEQQLVDFMVAGALEDIGIVRIDQDSPATSKARSEQQLVGFMVAGALEDIANLKWSRCMDE